MDDVQPISALVTGLVFPFADWPNNQVPRRAAGVYTIWRHEQFIYVGMSERGAKAEDFVAGEGKLLLDQMTKHFIRAHLSYRFAVYPDGAEALAAERTLRAGQSSAGRPYLNPL